MIPIGLALISAGLPSLTLYPVEEAFVFLLGLVVLLSIMVLLVLACLLLWHAVSAGFFWMKLFRPLRCHAIFRLVTKQHSVTANQL
jgi:hypothetical protein